MKFVKLVIMIVCFIILMTFTNSISNKKEENFSLDAKDVKNDNGVKDESKNDLGSIKCKTDSQYYNIALDKCVAMKGNYE